MVEASDGGAGPGTFGMTMPAEGILGSPAMAFRMGETIDQLGIGMERVGPAMGDEKRSRVFS